MRTWVIISIGKLDDTKWRTTRNSRMDYQVIAHVKNPNYIPKISDETRSIVEQFAEALMKNNKDVSPRRLETIFNLTIAHAKVKLKHLCRCAGR